MFSRAIVALAAGLAVSACVATGGAELVSATATPTVAFESIEGPPEAVFRRLVQTLSDEAMVRQVAVVSRDAPAQFRIRSYLAAVTEGKRSTVSWVWDVYDGEQHRALRIAGEEPASGGGTWAVIDDTVLRRIARNGIDQLSAFLNSAPAAPAPLPAAPAPDAREPAVAEAAITATAYASVDRP